MTEDRDRRTETAKQNDDSDIIDSASENQLAPGEQEGRSGGNLQKDVGTQAAKQRVAKPTTEESVTKSDEIADGQS